MTDLDTRTSRRRTIIGAALVAVLAGVLIAIVVVRSTGEKVLNDGNTLVLVGKDSEAKPMARIGGELTDVGGCLGIMVVDTPTLVVWPHGTTVKTPDPLRVTVDGKVYRIGDSIELGGAGTDALGASSFFHDKVPEACRSAKVFFAN